MADKLVERYGGIVSNVEFCIAMDSEIAASVLTGMLERPRAA